MNCVIRTAGPEDYPRMLEIYGWYVEHTAVSFEYEVPSAKVFSERIERILERFPCLVAQENGGSVCGYAYAGAFHERAAYERCVETTIYLDPEQRRKGIGRALYDALESRLRSEGYLNMYACIGYPEKEDEYLTKDSALFHKKCGFTEIGRFHFCGYKFGRWYDMIWMEKIIGDHAAGSAWKRADRETAVAQFMQYASEYDLSDVKVKLKVDHTFQVAEICEQIAASLNLNSPDRDRAFMMGLLHDIGRFEQLRRYHTFRDAVSVNHAQLGADLLFQDGLIRRFTQDAADDRLIETAIRYHNVFELSFGLSPRERMFCQILRDADKIDILRVNRETPMTEIYDLPEEAFLDSEISDAVFEDLMAHRNVNRVHSRTGMDFLMGHIAFVFGLVYPLSFRLVMEQGYLEEMLSAPTRNEQTAGRLKRVREEVHSFLESRVNV